MSSWTLVFGGMDTRKKQSFSFFLCRRFFLLARLSKRISIYNKIFKPWLDSSKNLSSQVSQIIAVQYRTWNLVGVLGCARDSCSIYMTIVSPCNWCRPVAGLTTWQARFTRDITWPITWPSLNRFNCTSHQSDQVAIKNNMFHQFSKFR